MYLTIIGNREIRQFTVEEDGIYAWRNKHASEWTFGKLEKGDKIDDQYEGCGPLKFEADSYNCIHDEADCSCI